MEMNEELSKLRAAAHEEASKERGGAVPHQVTVPLVTKDISFGVMTARPDGTEDLTGIVGIDSDLVIKPFGWKGVWPNVRRFAEGSLQFHFGIQAESLVETNKHAPIPERVGR